MVGNRPGPNGAGESRGNAANNTTEWDKLANDGIEEPKLDSVEKARQIEAPNPQDEGVSSRMAGKANPPDVIRLTGEVGQPSDPANVINLPGPMEEPGEQGAANLPVPVDQNTSNLPVSVEQPNNLPAPAEVENAAPAEREKGIEDYLGLKGRGEKAAMIVSQANKDDRENILREAIATKEKQISREHPIITRFPVVGRVIRAGMIAWGSREAKKAAAEGDFDRVFESMNLDPSASRMIGANKESSEDRAWEALKGAGYENGEDVNSVTSRLDQNERIEKLDEVSQARAKDALNNYYRGLKEGKSEEELNQAFDQALKDGFSKDDKSLLYSLQQKRDGLREMAQDADISVERVEKYLDENVTLYKANMKEGSYMRQEVDGIVKATIAGGMAGAIGYALLTRETQSKARGLMGSVVGAGGVSALAGGVFGAVSGIGKAKERLADAEIDNANKFDNNAEAAAEDNPERPEGVPAEKRNMIGKLFNGLGNLKRGLTGEEKHINKIEELRDRKDANELIKNFDTLMEAADKGDENAVADLRKAYVDALARGRFSSEKKIDLIKYDKNSRSTLEQRLQQAEKRLFGSEDAAASELQNPNSGLMKEIEGRSAELLKDYKAARWERAKYITRSAVVDGVVGAATGFAAGSICHYVTSKLHELMSAGGLMGKVEAAEAPENGEANVGEPGQPVFEQDEQGGYSLTVDGEKIIGDGDEAGLQFAENGALNQQSIELLKSKGFNVEEITGSRPVTGAFKMTNWREFFTPENKDVTHLTNINYTDGYPVSIGEPTADGDGNLIFHITSNNPDVNLDDMTMTVAPNGGSGQDVIPFDVGPDGTVTIPAGSPAADLMLGGNAGYTEIHAGWMNGDGSLTSGDTLKPDMAIPDNLNVHAPNPDAAINDYSYKLTKEGQSFFGWQITPDKEITIDADDKPPEIDSLAYDTQVANTGLLLGTDEPNGVEGTGETFGMTDGAGNPVEVEKLTHYGGYQSVNDSFYSPNKDAIAGSGESIVKRVITEKMGQDGFALSTEDADTVLLQGMQSGQVTYSDVINTYFGEMSNSPESLVTFRALMGGLEADINGDGVPESIDTQDEINALADILSRGDQGAYDNFVNDTQDLFSEKAGGGSVFISDLRQDMYDTTTWANQAGDGNIIQAMGSTGGRDTNGLGLVINGQDGQSIFDNNVASSLFQGNVNNVRIRLDCIQPVADEVEQFISGGAPVSNGTVVGQAINEGTTNFWRGSAAELEVPGSSPEAETPGSAADLETPGSAIDLETPGSAAGLETPGSAADLEVPGSSPEAETPGSSPEAETPGSSPEAETPGSSPEAETPGSSPEAETPGSSPENETTDTGDETPDTGDETPDTGDETPDTGDETPDTGDETPDTGTETEYDDSKGPIDITTEDSGFDYTEENTEQPTYDDVVYGDDDNSADYYDPGDAVDDIPADNTYEPVPEEPTDTVYTPDTDVWEGGQDNVNQGDDIVYEPEPDMSNPGSEGEYVETDVSDRF